MEANDYNRCLYTFLNWRYETPVRLAMMSLAPIAIAKAVIKDYYEGK